MKVTKLNSRYWECEIQTDEDFLEIMTASCLHKGNKNHNAKLWEKCKDWLQAKGNRFLLGMGDFGEYSLPGDTRGTTWSQDMTPMEQIMEIAKELKPFREKIIGLIDGNHEERIWRPTSLEPNYIISEFLDVPYLGVGGYIDFLLTNPENTLLDIETNEPDLLILPYTGFFLHGEGLGGHPLTRFKKVYQKHGKFIDFFVIAHKHQFAQHPFAEKNYRTGEVREIRAVSTAGFKNDPDYEFKRQYEGSLQGASIIKLYSKRKRIEVDNSGEVKFL